MSWRPKPHLNVNSDYLVFLWNVPKWCTGRGLKHKLEADFHPVRFIETFEAWKRRLSGKIVIEFGNRSATDTFIATMVSERIPFLQQPVFFQDLLSMGRHKFFELIHRETDVDLLECDGRPPSVWFTRRARDFSISPLRDRPCSPRRSSRLADLHRRARPPSCERRSSTSRSSRRPSRSPSPPAAYRRRNKGRSATPAEGPPSKRSRKTSSPNRRRQQKSRSKSRSPPRTADSHVQSKSNKKENGVSNSDIGNKTSDNNQVKDALELDECHLEMSITPIRTALQERMHELFGTPPPSPAVLHQRPSSTVAPAADGCTSSGTDPPLVQQPCSPVTSKKSNENDGTVSKESTMVSDVSSTSLPVEVLKMTDGNQKEVVKMLLTSNGEAEDTEFHVLEISNLRNGFSLDCIWNELRVGIGIARAVRVSSTSARFHCNCTALHAIRFLNEKLSAFRRMELFGIAPEFAIGKDE